jgi:hypothetical protein
MLAVLLPSCQNDMFNQPQSLGMIRRLTRQQRMNVTQMPTLVVMEKI